MKKAYKEKIPCWFCEGQGTIMVVNFIETDLKTRKLWNLNKLQKPALCPCCEGKGFLQINIKKLT